MAEKIYTIPINEAFQQSDQCPFCALRTRYESEALDYILGPAMMESDIRMETNRLGFCKKHFTALLARQKRQPLGLILESHLMAIQDALAQSDGKRKRKSSDLAEQLSAFAHSCYICNRLDTLEGRTTSNAVHMWKTDREYRARFEARSDYCLPHIAALLEAAGNELGGQYAQFIEALTPLINSQLDALLQSVQGFNASFDYRNAGKPLSPGEIHAIENAIAFLTGYAP